MLFALGGFDVSAGQLVAVAAVLLLSATHYVGVREGSRIQGLFTSLIVVALVGLGRRWSLREGFGFRFGVCPARPVRSLSRRSEPRWWASSGCCCGWNAKSPPSPGRCAARAATSPFALDPAARRLVMLLYVGANVACSQDDVLVGQLAKSDHPATVAATTLFGSGAAVAIAFTVTAAAAGCLSA